MTDSNRRSPTVLSFSQITLDDIDIVGGKNASMGEMIRELTPRGVRVPDGFAVSATAYRDYTSETKLDHLIRRELTNLEVRNIEDLQERGLRIRRAFLDTPLPSDLEMQICAAYDELGSGQTIDVAVRSSATAEDLPEASFAGQQETYLNISGHEALLQACHRCMASLFTDRAISYREARNFDHLQVALSIGVQRMVRSDLASAGVIFTIDPESGFKDAVLITAAFGLGESVVGGLVNPDEFYVFKPTLKQGFKPVLQKTLGTKASKLVYDPENPGALCTVDVPPEERSRFALNDDEILQLADWSVTIEEHYSQRHGRPTPMDIEWAKDGKTGELFIVQARPETVQSQRQGTQIDKYHLQGKGRILSEGRGVGEKVAVGKIRVIEKTEDLDQFREGEVLVSDRTDPDWEPVMKLAAAIVTNSGGRTCHAAIVCREAGLPAVVGTTNATEVLKDGTTVTVSCCEGEIGRIYDGEIPYEVETLDLGALKRPNTKIMMNVANPRQAFKNSMIPNDGVGLAREEFIVSNYIKAHPLALLAYPDIDDHQEKTRLEALTQGYTDKPQFFIDRLAQGVAMIASAFYPKDVIVRMSDFKSNEYANLVGGNQFEPSEENPMLGFRGASRYYSDSYREAFALECKAMLKAREEMGLTNIKLMIPFCRTVKEGRQVISEMAAHGLVQGENELEIYVMCEIPSNVILAAEFAEIFDGFSIGSNDLTQLVLGVDRDSTRLAELFDERDDAVCWMISRVIKIAKENGKRIGICGQAPSDYPDFTRFLLENGIDSISLIPDAVLGVTKAVLEFESNFGAE